MSDFRAVILGSDENAYGAARLFYEINGVKPLLVCTRPLPVTAGSTILNIEAISGIDTKEVFEKKMPEILAREKANHGKVYVIPCADYYADLCIKSPECVKDAENRFIDKALYEKLETKDKFRALCAEHGLPHPRTAIIGYDERETAADGFDFGYPLVLKPENSNSYDYLHCSFEGKKKVYYIKDREEYLRTVRAMTKAGYKGALVAQEYIPGGDDALYVMNTYSGPNGKVRLMSLGQAVMEECAPGMRGNYAVIISRFDGMLYAKVKAFLESVHYVGFANFDMKYDPRTGEYAVFEINPRQGRSSFYVRAGGLNIMRAVVEPPKETVYGKEIALWSAVPKCVIKKHCENESLKREALELWKTKGAARTLFEKRDKCLKRRINALKREWYSVKTFNTYYKNKNGSD